MKKKVIIKGIILTLFLVILRFLKESVSPLVANELALSQMRNSIDSSMGIQVYSQLSEYSWLVVVLLVFIIFHREIFELINKIKKEKQNEEN